jgi:hypothetical protein
MMMNMVHHVMMHHVMAILCLHRDRLSTIRSGLRMAAACSVREAVPARRPTERRIGGSFSALCRGRPGGRRPALRGVLSTTSSK